jgi:hypothetical protein
MAAPAITIVISNHEQLLGVQDNMVGPFSIVKIVMPFFNRKALFCLFYSVIDYKVL